MTEATESLSLIDLKLADLNEDIAKLTAKRDALLSQKENAAKLDAIKAGDSVTVKYGRGEKVRDITGTVVARDADTLAVQYGEGLDAQIVKVSTGAVVFPAAE